MPGDTKKRKNEGKKNKEVSNPSQNEKGTKKLFDKKLKLKSKTQVKNRDLAVKHKKGFDRLGEGKGNALRRKRIIKKAILHKTKSLKKQSSSSSRSIVDVKNCKDGEKCDSIDEGLQKAKRKRKRKRRNGNVVLDEAARLQRRTRYLLIKVKLEQNLIDAYSAEGWKGQSREKIRPEKELERAKKQILKCKLGIREAIRQLDLLGSVGHIEDSAVAPDGSVHHENIICAKCKLREAFPDNDIILCDGTCNCAFHQKCLDPPLSTESRDEGWFCRYCKSKMEILEATNAHLGTNFAMDSNWQDIFREEAVLPDGRESIFCHEEEWPSDDPEDADYDPERMKYTNSMSSSGSDSCVDTSSSSSLMSIDDDVLFLSQRPDKRQKASEDNSTGAESDEATDCETLCGPRLRKTVDYIKLHDEMFGKNAPVGEQISEDEDWGPSRRKHRGKESNAEIIFSASGENQNNSKEERITEVKEKPSTGRSRRPIFRFPRNVVEKLRLVFAENELPSRTIREDLSKQLGLESEKVNKWFKNARYLALKARKKAIRHDASGPTMSQDSVSGTGDDEPADPLTSQNVAVAHESETPSFKGSSRRKTARLVASAFKRQRNKTAIQLLPTSNKTLVDFGDDVSLKLLREKVKRKKKLNINRAIMLEAEAEMERLCAIKDKIEKLQQVLLRLPSSRYNKANEAALNELAIIYVPVAELREKR